MDLTEWNQAGAEPVDIEHVNKLCARAFKIRELKAELNEKEKAFNAELEEIKTELMEIFNASKLDGFDATEGRVSLKDYFNVRTPKSVEDKKKFAKYLEKKKVFWEMMSFNSAQVNSFFEAEMEIAKQNGDVDFTVPGLGEKTHSQDISFRKKAAKKGQKDESESN